MKEDRYVDALRGRVWALDMAKLWVVAIGVAYPSCDIAEYRLPLLIHLGRVRSVIWTWTVYSLWCCGGT